MTETYTYLTDEDRENIIISKIKNLEYSIYHSEMSILEENASGTPDVAEISSLQSQVAKAKLKIDALKSQLA